MVCLIFLSRYASSGTNLRSVATSSMSNIHTASLSTVDKTSARSETELFAVPKVCQHGFGNVE